MCGNGFYPACCEHTESRPSLQSALKKTTWEVRREHHSVISSSCVFSLSVHNSSSSPCSASSSGFLYRLDFLPDGSKHSSGSWHFLSSHSLQLPPHVITQNMESRRFSSAMWTLLTLCCRRNCETLAAFPWSILKNNALEILDRTSFYSQRKFERSLLSFANQS